MSAPSATLRIPNFLVRRQPYGDDGGHPDPGSGTLMVVAVTAVKVPQLRRLKQIL
jgi:hypothetical protein